MTIELANLSDGPGFTYDSGGLTLTAGMNASINQFGVGGIVTPVRDLINGDFTLVSFTAANKERAGRYVITDVGGPDLWNSGTTYSQGDQVQRGNILWDSSVNTNLNNDPYTDLVSWDPQFISPTGASGATIYAGGTTYAAGVVVISSGVLYVSRAGSNTGNTPASSAAWWTIIPAVGGMKSTAGPLILTRADDFNTAAEILPGSYFLVTAGDDAGCFYYLSTTEQTYVLDFTPLEFTKSGTGTYTAGNGLLLSTNQFSVDVDGVTIQVGASGIELMGGSVARSYLESSVLNTIATGGASGTTATTNTGTGTAATFNVPVNTTVFAEIVLEAVNDAADSKRFIQKGYIGYRRGASGNAFPVGDTEDVTMLPAFAATGTGSIAALTWTTLALSDNTGDVQVNVTGPGGGINVTYRSRVRLY